MWLLYREIYRRITRAEIHDVSRTDQRPGQKAAILFVKRCTNRGVPKKFIIDSSDTIRITATRAIGLGSQSAKYDITQQMLGVSHMFDGKGKRVALREYVSARVGSSNTNRYAGMVDRNQVPSLEMSFAIVENALLSDGKTVLATVDQNQEVHTNALLSGLLGPILQAYGQNKLQDLRAGVVGLTAGLEHLTAHMDIMTEDTRYKQQLEQLQQFAKQAVQVQKTLMAAVQKQAQEQQAAQKKQQQTVAAAEGQLRGEGETAAIIKARGDVQVKAMTQDSLNRVREVKAQETMQIKKDLAESMIALKAREAEADILIKNLKAQAARQATVVQ